MSGMTIRASGGTGSGLAGHEQVGADEVNMELRPGRGTDICGDRKSNSRLTFAHCSRGTDLEPEPVSNVSARRSSQSASAIFACARYTSTSMVARMPRSRAIRAVAP
jgi:hypothetical protein